MTIWYKQGVEGDLQIPAQKGLRKLANLFARYGRDVFITSIRDGYHSQGSLHHIGMAFDIRPPNDINIEGVKGMLGDDYDCLDEGNHWHIEYDPEERR